MKLDAEEVVAAESTTECVDVMGSCDGFVKLGRNLLADAFLALAYGLILICFAA